VWADPEAVARGTYVDAGGAASAGEKMLGGEDALGTRPMLARQLDASDTPTG
jgi:hypothetical protein